MIEPTQPYATLIEIGSGCNMPVGLQAAVPRRMDGDTIRRAADLLSQQIWCWGQDIVRPEGNWLLESGFDRVEPPADREGCSSVYTLQLPRGRRVVLRGFGVFFGDDRLGGVLLRRYEFRPQYTPQPTLQRPPWLGDDLPPFAAPNDSQRDGAARLTVDLIDWTRSYEQAIVERLGAGYRQATLDNWKNNKRPMIPAVEMVASWREIGLAVADDFDALVG